MNTPTFTARTGMIVSGWQKCGLLEAFTIPKQTEAVRKHEAGLLFSKSNPTEFVPEGSEPESIYAHMRLDKWGEEEEEAIVLPADAPASVRALLEHPEEDEEDGAEEKDEVEEEEEAKQEEEAAQGGGPPAPRARRPAMSLSDWRLPTANGLLLHL